MHPLHFGILSHLLIEKALVQVLIQVQWRLSKTARVHSVIILQYQILTLLIIIQGLSRHPISTRLERKLNVRKIGRIYVNHIHSLICLILWGPGVVFIVIELFEWVIAASRIEVFRSCSGTLPTSEFATDRTLEALGLLRRWEIVLVRWCIKLERPSRSSDLRKYRPTLPCYCAIFIYFFALLWEIQDGLIQFCLLRTISTDIPFVYDNRITILLLLLWLLVNYMFKRWCYRSCNWKSCRRVSKWLLLRFLGFELHQRLTLLSDSLLLYIPQCIIRYLTSVSLSYQFL